MPVTPKDLQRRPPDQPALAPSVAASPNKGRPRSPCSSTDSSPAGDELASMGDKADWSDGFLRNLFDACKEEIEAGNRPMGIFTATGWKNVVSKFADKSGDKRTKKQLKNKLDILKKDYTVFMEFKNCATGLGYGMRRKKLLTVRRNGGMNTLLCNNPEKGINCSHVKFRKHGPKFLEDMHIIFGKAHVDGSTAACPRDIFSNDTSDEDVAEVPKLTKEKEKTVNQGKRKHKAVEEKEKKSPFFRMYKNTCLKIESAAERISTSVEASSAPTINQIPTIAEAVKMVKECGVEEGTALMYTAWSALANPEFREFFGSLETNKGRLDLIQREHEKEKNKKEGSN